MTAHPWILWSIRLSLALYLLAIGAAVRRRDYRALWTAAWMLFVVHALAAFHYSYGWSHAVAVRETARQTLERTGFDSEAGIYWNYAMVILWSADLLWWWISPGSRRLRPSWVTRLVHGYLGWMVVQGAVVFAPPPVRWFTIAASVLLAALWLRERRVAVLIP